MKKLTSSLIGGIAGAFALNVLHQVVKAFDHEAPRVDLVGAEDLSRGLKSIGKVPPAGDHLFAATLSADLLSNGGYYSLAGTAKKKMLPLTGTF